MSAYIDAIATTLVNAGLAGGTTGWAIQKIDSQDKPDQIVVVAETGGPPPEQDSARRWGRPSFQVRVRGAIQGGPKAASDKAWAILAALDRAAVTGFDSFKATQSTPISMGADVEGRHGFVVNFSGGEA